ncbi:MAG TPA: carboxypeptidase-like regulatory domain-containing protein [Bryobacteraceae bacterium]|nr:carboxypeptidase-like regulatory domain-containing protein [Bryobacteraceae bacterium]
MRRVPVFRVFGRVVDERGEPAAGAVLQVSTARMKATADGDGKFEWQGVRAGNEVVQAEWHRGDSLLRGFTPITVQDHDIENVTVRVAPPVIVSGTVELDGKPAPVEGGALLEPVDGEGSPDRVSFSASEIRFEGVYPGRYQLHVYVSTGFGHSMYMDSVRLGERDITMDPFEIGPGLLPFRVILKTGGGHVRGTVDEGVGGIVVLVPKDERLRLPEFMATSFFSGSNFQVENVRPGDYYAFAVKGVFNQGQMRDPAYAGPRLSGAPAVRVENNGTATVTLVYVNEPSVQ